MSTDSDISLSSQKIRHDVTSTIADAMLDVFAFDEESTFVMDYACGTGALSQKLAPYCKSITGVDIDPAAVEQYNLRVANQGIPSEEMHAICLDLRGAPSTLERQLFDVVVCSRAYHHFPSINKTTRLLASFLKPQTGILLVSDLLKGAHAHEFRSSCAHSHDEKKIVAHKGGLREHEVRESFQQAGLVNISFEVIETVKKNGREVEIFLAQGIRPAH